MRGRLAVLMAAELLTLLPMNNPGVSEGTKRCTVADLNGTYVSSGGRRLESSTLTPPTWSLIPG
jgi:hypothetical protein